MKGEQERDGKSGIRITCSGLEGAAWIRDGAHLICKRGDGREEPPDRLLFHESGRRVQKGCEGELR